MKREAETHLPTQWGDLKVIAYAGEVEAQPHLALINESYDPAQPVWVRVHSECMTGDVFGSRRCDCQEQLHYGFEMISKHGGVMIYLRQEGRGIGLINKLKAYSLQDQGLNTIEANLHLGFEADGRHFEMAIAMLEDLGISRIRLMTNNPEKLHIFDNSSVEVVSREPIEIPPRKENLGYQLTKQHEMGHLLHVERFNQK